MNGKRFADFNITEYEINTEELERFDTEDDFMYVAVELLKECGQMTALVAGIYPLDSNYKPRTWNRNEAILMGLLVRISKLIIALKDQSCRKREEIIGIFIRCIIESEINLKYLMNDLDDENAFDAYIEFSLREEKRLMNFVNEQVSSRGYEHEFEARIKKSINRVFRDSGFEPSQVNEISYKPWGGSIYKKAQNVNMELQYNSMFSMPCHNVHGNWQDLLSYHLKKEDDGFSPEFRFTRPRSPYLFGVILHTASTLIDYIKLLIPVSQDQEELTKRLEGLIKRTKVAYDYQESFVQRSQNS